MMLLLSKRTEILLHYTQTCQGVGWGWLELVGVGWGWLGLVGVGGGWWGLVGVGGSWWGSF